MILLDASVLIDYLRHRDPRLAAILNQEQIGLCGVTRAEVLHGAVDDRDAQQLTRLLDSFTPVDTPSSVWDRLGRNLRILRLSGIAVPLSDALLATLAIELGVPVWTTDRHFQIMTSVLPLQLYAPVT